MASIDRTAYPRFKRSVPARELREAFTPTGEEAGWAGAATRSTSHQLALVVMLKCFQRLGYFPAWHDVPAVVVEHVRGCLGFDDAVRAEYESQRTVRHHRWLVRSRLGVQCDGETIRGLAEKTIRAAAATKDNPADLINVALEELVRSRCELPGYSTLDEMAARVRAEVNGVIFEGINAAMTDSDRARLDRLLRVDPVTRRSAFDQLKVTARAATVSKFKAHLAHLVWLDSLGATQAWLAGVPPAKLVGFAGEARVTDVADLRKVGDVKRRALMACLLNTARVRARDEVVTMFCKRMATIHKKARDRLTRLREQQRADAERLLDVFGEVLAVVRDALAPSEEEATTGEVDPTGVTCERTGRQVLGALAAAGGVAALSSTHEAVTAHSGNNYLPLLERYYRSHRSTLFLLLDALQLEATSADHRVLDAVGFLKAYRNRHGEFVPDHVGGEPLDLSFAADAWQKILRDRRRPTRLVRRHLEVCVFSHLAAELRTGDVAVVGSDSYANLHDQLLGWDECAPLVAGYCAEAGLPADAAGFVDALRAQLTTVAARVDAGYPDNADLVIDESGQPMLKRRRGTDRRASALALEAALTERLPEWSLLDVLTRTAYWLGWHRHFGPLSGSDPKIRDALGRYVLLTFTYGANLGPAQVARHMRGRVSVHELATANKHATAMTVHAASTDVINAFARLDLPALWGDGSRAAADGTQLDTWSDNLLAETSIRYGTGVRTGFGGARRAA